MNSAPTSPPLEACKRVFGEALKLRGMLAIATALKVNERAIYFWGGVIPQDRKYELYVLANGRLTLAELELQEDFNARKLPKKKPRPKAG